MIIGQISSYISEMTSALFTEKKQELTLIEYLVTNIVPNFLYDYNLICITTLEVNIILIAI